MNGPAQRPLRKSPGGPVRGTPPSDFEDPRLEALFGEAAQALEARALPAGPRWPAGSDASARLCLRRSLLSGTAEAILRELTLREGPPTPGGLDTLELDAAGLEQAAGRVRELAPLWEVHANVCRPPGPPRLMGIVNATPDSFSDGGRYLDPARAQARARELVAAGAELIDVGGESTRPGAEAVPAEVELQRVLGVLEGLGDLGAELSVDTRKASVAAAALDRGAQLVNDVSAGRSDPRMIPLVAERGCTLVLMHMRGSPRDMQRDPRYVDPVQEITAFLRRRVSCCLKAGVGLHKILIDPGIGFGKRLEDNLALIRRAGELRSLGLVVLMGVSRKSFLSTLGGAPWGAAKLGETASAVTACIAAGVEVLRVHDVAELAGATKVAWALQTAGID